MKAPGWDKDYASHPVHGVRAQYQLIRAATGGLPCKRVAVDVGAHIGLTAIPLAEQFIDVHAFEPEVENHNCLLQNTMQYPNIYRYPVALGRSPGFRGMALPDDNNSGCWYLHDDGKNVLVHTLDAYGLTNVDFIKIDTEGTEGEVILGAQKTIKKYKPTIFFEDNHVGPKYYGEKWVDPKVVLRKLEYYPAMRMQKNEIWKPL